MKNKNEITFIVQARSGSTRLPNKILLPFHNGKSILELLIDKLKMVSDTNIIIATSLEKNCDAVSDVAIRNGVCCFRGAEHDVLQRFIDAAENYGVERIIRVCSDNPFLELASIQKLISHIRSITDLPDYVGFSINGTPSIKTHFGFWTEYVTLSALKAVKSLTGDPLYHEHVTNFIYTHPDRFKIEWIAGPQILDTHSDIRLTIDTEDDFINAQEIYRHLCSSSYPTIEDIVIYLDAHKEYYQRMKTQIDKNTK